MSDDLVQRVALAIDSAICDGDQSSVAMELTSEEIKVLARAAIAVCMEEAAKVAENYDGPGMESVPDATWGDAQATKDDIAYYIRALVKET